VGAVFFLNGLVLASWVPYIPLVKAAHGLRDGVLGGVLLAMAVGAVMVLPAAGWLVGRHGSRRVTLLADFIGTRVNTGARGQGFGLTSSGGGGTGVTVDTANFCCPEYLSQMVTLIQRNWDSRQQAAGSVIMKFTVTRAGTIENVQVEQSSGFVAHELTAQRALLLTRLPELPIQYPNPTLTIHMRFEYQR